MKRLLKVLLVLLMTVAGVFPPAVIQATAETVTLKIESTNVLDDLKEMTVDGKAFDISGYIPKKKPQTEVLVFSEICYSPYDDLRANYGLYVYVYNPQGEALDVGADKNQIQFSYGNRENYNLYPLIFLNQSTEKGYEGLFIKYKIGLTNEQKTEMFKTFKSNPRSYSISGIELLTKGNTNATETRVGTVYSFTGYALGYGENPNEGTLTCTKGNIETWQANVHPTFFRPEGANGKNSYTKDSLASVYFSVPNHIIRAHERLSAVKAEWLKAMTNWGLVTGDKTYFDEFEKYLGMTACDYTYLKNYGITASIDDTVVTYNVPRNYDFKGTEEIRWLSYLFYSGEGKDSADSYILPSETLYEWMQAYHDKYDNYETKSFTAPPFDGAGIWMPYQVSTPYGGRKVRVSGETYEFSKALFERVDKEKTTAEIEATDKYSLTSEKISQNWWEKLTGTTHVVSSSTFDGIEAIKAVTKEDFKTSVSSTCRGLYISENDYTQFKDFYDVATSKDETVYLFRFDVGEYSALEAYQGTWRQGGLITGLGNGNTNAYIFKGNVYLGFDIIQLTFGTGESKYVLPAVMSPIDIIPSPIPPIITHPDRENGIEGWKIALAVVLLIFMLWLLRPILSLLLQGVIWVICLPFKLIGGLFKKGKGG